jgi:hypothetical protein
MQGLSSRHVAFLDGRVANLERYSLENNQHSSHKMVGFKIYPWFLANAIETIGFGLTGPRRNQTGRSSGRFLTLARRRDVRLIGRFRKRRQVNKRSIPIHSQRQSVFGLLIQLDRRIVCESGARFDLTTEWDQRGDNIRRRSRAVAQLAVKNA